jgi:flavin reductase (DIM6/NTAB) family NADH-FMN oxidoreductase RutF
MFSAYNRWNGDRTDSVTNAESTGEFVFNMATYALRDAVVRTAMIEQPGIDEMAEAGLTPAESRIVKPPRVKECPVSLECKHHQSVVLVSDTPGMFNSVVIGRVVGVHISDDVIGADGKLDVIKMRPLARMGYLDYTSVTEVFELRPPDVSEDFIRGMSGGSGAKSK